MLLVHNSSSIARSIKIVQQWRKWVSLEDSIVNAQFIILIMYFSWINQKTVQNLYSFYIKNVIMAKDMFKMLRNFRFNSYGMLSNTFL